jgi:hypothetical protein
MSKAPNGILPPASNAPVPGLPTVLAQLQTSADDLTATQAKQRLTQYGYNELPENKRNALLEFCAHFRGPIPCMIEAAAVRPAPLLFWFTILTKVLATLAAVYGWFMVPIGWEWAGLIWGYALVWFLVNDRVRLAAYRILDLGQSVLAGTSAQFNGPAAARQRPQSHA